MPICDMCRRNKAVVYQPHTGRKLCKQCFIEDVKKRVVREVKTYNMISASDKIALALSGGKDSFVLLDVLSEIHDTSNMFAITIIEGIHGYNKPEYVERLKRETRKRGIDHIIVSFKEYVGKTLDELIILVKQRNAGISPCTYCGALRRRIINTYARMLGATKTATAHNLDDEAQTSLMNILRGDIIRLLRQHPLAPSFSKYFVRRVKPLRRIYEWETAMYAFLKRYSIPETECPYLNMHPTLRAKLRQQLQILESKHPGVLLKILEATDSIAYNLIGKISELPELPHCIICGEPTSHNREICKVCELLLNIGVSPVTKHKPE